MTAKTWSLVTLVTRSKLGGRVCMLLDGEECINSRACNSDVSWRSTTCNTNQNKKIS